jgi:hypothetical protein
MSTEEYKKVLDEIQKLVDYGRTKDDPRDLIQVMTNIAVKVGLAR